MNAGIAHATHTDLAAIRPKQRGSGFAVLRRAREAVTTDGKPFLDLELSDTTATLAAKV